MQFSLVSNGSTEQVITVFVPGEPAPFVAHSDHPNFRAIVAAVTESSDPADVIKLFDASAAVAESFDRLTDRVSVAHGHVFFDGDEVHGSIERHIVRSLDFDADNDRLMGLVYFLENVQTNPEPHSREQLYSWLTWRDFTITPDGHFIAYKGVANTTTEGVYQSINSGSATVNDEPQNGHITQQIGDVVRMPRSQVQHDPSVGCHTGLHAGTFDYASHFGRGTTLTVKINPRDVVSVPSDCEAQKLRVCAYEVLGVTETEYDSPYYDDDAYDADEDWDGEDE